MQNVHTIGITDDDMDIKKTMQLNDAVKPSLLRIEDHIKSTSDKQQNEGRLVIPGFTIGLTSVISAILEYFHRALESGTITKDSLQSHVCSYRNEPYSKGINLYMDDEVSQLIPNIAIKIINISNNARDDIYWRGKLNRKAIISIAIYYVASTLPST